MVKRNVRKAGKAGKVKGRVSRESEELLLLGSALSEQMLHLLSQVATTPKGIGAMAWATLKDVATCECVEVESLFDREVAFFEGVLVDSE